MSSGELGGFLEALDAGGEMHVVGESSRGRQVVDTFAQTAEDAAVARAHERAERYRREAREEQAQTARSAPETSAGSRSRGSMDSQDSAVREARMHAEQVRELGRVL